MSSGWLRGLRPGASISDLVFVPLGHAQPSAYERQLDAWCLAQEEAGAALWAAHTPGSMVWGSFSVFLGLSFLKSVSYSANH